MPLLFIGDVFLSHLMTLEIRYGQVEGNLLIQFHLKPNLLKL